VIKQAMKSTWERRGIGAARCRMKSSPARIRANLKNSTLNDGPRLGTTQIMESAGGERLVELGRMRSEQADWK
jgi:hypothetical protein